MEHNTYLYAAFLDDKQISNNARYFLQRFAQAKADKLTRKLSKQNRQSTENEIVEELTEMFEKKYLDHMETNFSLMNASDDDELSFKAWQSCKILRFIYNFRSRIKKKANNFFTVFNCSKTPRFS